MSSARFLCAIVAASFAASVGACLLTVDESLVGSSGGVGPGSGPDAGSGSDGGPTTDGTTSPADGASASDGPPAAPTCPNTGKGATMIRIGAFCIDHREATFADVRQFVLSGAATAKSTAPPECGFKTKFEPAFWPRPAEQDPLPAHELDWCDAWAYCAWAGKRLCGGPEGAALDYTTPNVATDEWYFACTNGLETQFTYGSSYDPAKCNIDDSDGGIGMKPPGSMPLCHGIKAPFDMVTDLVGNIGEWQRSCETAGVDPATQKCRVRGGNWYDKAQQGCTDTDALARNDQQSKAGIRCCADPVR